MDVEFKLFSINGKMLGAGEPIRVQPSQRVLFRIVNASATLHHRLALPGHLFRVIALDGNPVPAPARVPILDLGPGERVDAIVEMNRPGVWILGEVRTDQRDGRDGNRRRVRRPAGRAAMGAARGRSCGTTRCSAAASRCPSPTDA